MVSVVILNMFHVYGHGCPLKAEIILCCNHFDSNNCIKANDMIVHSNISSPLDRDVFIFLYYKKESIWEKKTLVTLAPFI